MSQIYDENYNYPKLLEQNLSRYKGGGETGEEINKFIIWLAEESGDDGITMTGIVDLYRTKYGLGRVGRRKADMIWKIYRELDKLIESEKVVFSKEFGKFYLKFVQS